MLFENLVLRLLIEILARMDPHPAREDNKVVEKAWRYIEHHIVEKDYKKL